MSGGRDNQYPFDFYRGEAPHVGSSETSREAAQSIEAAVGPLCRDILDYVAKRGEHGATCDEVIRDLQMKHQTASARVSEMAQKGWLVDSGGKRKTSSGRRAVVYVVRRQ